MKNPNRPRKKWISGGLIFILAFGYGFFALRERSTEHRANLRQEGHRIATENAELRAKLREVGSQGTPTMDAYVQKCMQLEPLVIAAQNAQKAEADYFVRAEREYSGNPAVLQTLSFLARMRDKDRQGLAVLAEEISRAKQLKMMSADDQRVFYREQIEPLHAQIHKLSEEETAIAKEAQAAGANFPKDVSEMLK